MAEVAWYDIKAKGWLRDLFIILHFPYTLWHLAYVFIGAALAPQLNWATLGWTVWAFFLGMGIGAHCLDELNGRPLRTKIPGVLLWTLAVVSILGAISIGVFVGVRESVWVIPCIVFGGFIVFAYNMEWPRDWARFGLFRELGLVGFFHRDIWFGFAWGAFPVLTAYIAQTHTLSLTIILVAVACLGYSLVQRMLSTQARFWRRKVFMLEGHYFTDAPLEPNRPIVLTKQDIIKPAEVALQCMTWTVIVAALGLLLLHI